MPLPTKSRYTIAEAAKYIAAAAGEAVNSGQVLDWGVQGSYRLHVAVSYCIVMREGTNEILRDCLVEIRPSAEQAAKLARGERVSAAHCWRDGEEWQFARQRTGDYSGLRADTVTFGIAALAVVGRELAAFGASIQAPPIAQTSPADTQPQDAPEPVPVVEAPAREPKAPATGPIFTMKKSAMVKQHKHEWQSIERDMQDANRNGLDAAKAGAREWDEVKALEWARAKGKLTNIDKPAQSLSGAMNSMASLATSRKHTL